MIPKTNNAHLTVRIFLMMFIIMMLVTLTCGPAEAVIPSTRSLMAEEVQTLQEVRNLLSEYYVDPIPAAVLEAASVEKMLELLGDPHTSYMSAEAYKQFTESLDQSFSGIGIYVDTNPQGVLIVGVIEGSPASEGELLPGDIITRADDTELSGLPLNEAITYIQGPEGSTVNLEVLRNGETLYFSLVRRQISIPYVQGEFLEGDIGYIRLTSFGSDTGILLGAQFKRLQEQGAEGWILDLRNNGGGWVSAAQALLGYFIGNDTAFYARNYNHGREIRYTAIFHEGGPQGPVLLLVNEYSASASEIVAGALADYAKALLVGKTTYGKGSMQRTYYLPNPPGGMLKMTTHRFYSPGGQVIDGIGVRPHLVVETAETWEEGEVEQNESGQQGERDLILETARLLLSGMALEQGSERRLDLQLFGQQMAVDLEQARQEKSWSLFYPAAAEAASPGAEAHHFFYPRHQKVSRLEKSRDDFRLSIQFSHPVNQATVNENTVELVEETTGRRVGLEIHPEGSTRISVTPREPLRGSNYWLLVHQDVAEKRGQMLKTPVLAQITVK